MIELVICPLCRSEMHRHVGGPVSTRIRIPSRSKNAAEVMAMLAQMAKQEEQEEMAACEEACVEHYRNRHRLRLSLWRRFGWDWLMRWPTRNPRVNVGQVALDPLQFMETS